MKHFGLSIFLISFSAPSWAQSNLIPNGNFESYDTCPVTTGQIKYAAPWFQPNILGSSTDYFNSCASNSISSVPYNFIGFQTAHSGNGYGGGCVSFFPADPNGQGREYLEIPLLSALDSTNKYCVSTYVSLGNYSELSSAIGIYFSVDSLLYSSPTLNTIGVNPQLAENDLSKLQDTLSWTLLKWVFVPNDTFRFMTMGGFWVPPVIVYNCLTANCALAYYYYDDVSVILLPELDAGLNDTICSADSTILTGTISETWPGMQFEWLPHAGLSNPYSLITNASPTSTTTYTLTVSCATCDVPCLSDILDSVTITVVPQLNVSADDTVCPGDSVLLAGAISEQWVGMQYEWLPHTGLSDPYSLSTFASPAIATTYTLTATCLSCGINSCASLVDSSSVIVKMDCVPVLNEMIIPTVIASGQQWQIVFLPPQTSVTIYDERGRLIYKTENYKNDWMPQLAGAIYVYEITKEDGTMMNGKLLVE